MATKPNCFRANTMSTSGSSKHSKVPSIGAIIDSVKRTPVTVGGKKGCFINSDDLKAVEHRLDDYKKLRAENNISLDELEKVEADVGKLKAENAAAMKLKADNSALFESLHSRQAELTAEIVDLRAQHKSAVEARNSEKADLTKTLKEWQAYATTLKAKLAQGEDMPGSDVQVKLSVELEEARGTVKQAQLDLEKNNAAVTAANNAQAVKEAELSRIRHEHSAVASRVKELEAAFAAVERKVPPGEVHSLLADIKLDETVRKIVGAAAFKWLQDLQAISESDIRGSTFLLLRAARDSSNKKVSKLSALLQQLLDWIKTQSNKVRARAKPWLEMISRDIAAGKVQSVMFYREQLEKLVADHSFSKNKWKKETGKKPEYQTSTLEDIALWCQVLLINRPKRYFRSGVGWVRAKLSRVSLLVRGFFSKIWPSSLKWNKIYSNEEYAAFSEKEADNLAFTDGTSMAPEAEPLTGFTKVDHKGKGKEPVRRFGGIGLNFKR